MFACLTSCVEFLASAKLLLPVASHLGLRSEKDSLAGFFGKEICR